MEDEPILTDAEAGSSVEQIAKRFGLDPTQIVIISSGDLEGNLTRAILAQAHGKKVIVVNSLMELAPKEMHARIEGKMGEYVGMTIHDKEPLPCIPTVAKEKDYGRISGLVPKHAFKSKGKSSRGKKRK